MSIMTKFTWRSLAGNKVRTVVTIAGIALAAALLTAVLTSVASLGDFMKRNELATSGSWTASVWSWDDVSAESMAADSRIAQTASMQDVGVVELSADLAQYAGSMLSVVNVDGDIESICAVRAAEGRLPQDPGEIMLPMQFKDSTSYSDGPCAIGSEVTFDLSVNVVGGHEVCSGGYSGPKAELSSGVEDGFAPLRTQTYTVTGFYELPNWSLRTSYGLAAVTTGDPDASGSTRLFAVLANPESEGQIRDVMASYAAEDTDVVLHYGLLRYQGVFDNRQIWDSFGTMAVVLAVVIVLACVSLIYNAFGISVAQRKRQFGLLASVGASKRQIRASVFFEAGVMALAGIPLGIVVGLAGTAAVLSWLAPMIERVLAYDVPFTMHVAPAVIVAVALLTLLTVVLSAWVPAVRAGRATAMEAIRASRDVRAADSRNEARLQAKHAGCSADVSLSGSKGILEPKGLSFSRLFGVPGEIARLNRKRGRGKGSAASASLAIAVVLLMTAGSFSTYMRMTTDMIGSGAIDYDIGLYSGAGENLNHVVNAYDELSSLGGVTGRGWFASSSFVFRVPDSMASDSMGDVAFSEVADRTDGGYLCMGAVTVVEDAAFDEYASQCGVDPAVFEDGQFKGIAVRNSVERGGERYRVAQLLDAPGTLCAAYGGAQEGFLTFTYDSSELVAFVEQGSESDRPGSESAGDGVSMISFNEVSTLETQLEVVALADSDAPIMGGTVPYELTVVVPMRAVAHTALLESPAFFSTPSFTACFNAEDHAQAAIDIAEAGKRIMGVEVGVSDYKATEDDGRIMMLIVDVFTMLFTGILTLIAIANVFNTLTNSLLLRRREFAVMRSVGMGNAQFRKMIACECLGYGVRGLVPGLIISVGVSGLLFMSMTMSFEGLSFVLPWGHMAVAAALVGAAMALSVAYGLHRCRMDSVVEALREDAI